MIPQRRGPFVPGDQVQITDPKGRKHLVLLAEGRTFHTHRGGLAHDDLIGAPEGTVVKSSGGTPYVALRPLLADFTLSMSRGAAVVYPKDAAQIVALADIFPGARVLEAGAGSGALACWLLRAVGEDGLLVSYERRADFADIARNNVERFFGGPHPAWQLRVGDLMEVTDGLAGDGCRGRRGGDRRAAGCGRRRRSRMTRRSRRGPRRGRCRRAGRPRWACGCCEPGPTLARRPGKLTPPAHPTPLGLRIVSTGWYWTCWRHGSSQI